MAPRIFIDGEAGTTGLQIRERLVRRHDVTLIRLSDDERKSTDARLHALNECDLAILCLPDDAARESVSLIVNDQTRVIDASTAHRTDPNWVYGFPEMTAGQEEAVRAATRVSNPGCYPTAAIALIRPLVEAGLLPKDYPVTVNAISGYSGGGKPLIRRFEGPNGADEPTFYAYGLALAHKHLPELHQHTLLDHAPLFVPSVGRYYKGMLVQVPLQLWALPGAPGPNEVQAVLAGHYDSQSFVSVSPLDSIDPKTELDPEAANSTNELRLRIFAHADTGHCLLTAVLDNLGKGASGAAVQSMNLMLDLEPHAGLVDYPPAYS
ncbi:MAG: N-acetyl-gamma-glutamyl-phosphate reductase [Rhodospirillaceae bacterium]|nr:N-acetyl-gamma-glutamyl-phosphate reductase [Rhodospirillaceae bacterium]